MPENYKRLRDPPPILVINRRDPFFKKCCCLSLRTGCYLTGWISLIVAILYLIFQIAFLSLARSFLDRSLHERNKPKSELIRLRFDHSADLNFIIGYLIVIIIFIGTIAANVVMLYATYKKRPGYLRAYVFACLGIILLETILIIRNMGMSTATPLECFIALINISVSSFAAFIVSCHRQELLRDRESSENVEVALPCNAET